MSDTLYDTDFVRWTERQADALRQAAREGSNLPIDWENLAEEIESVGKRDRREAESYVARLIEHLLKLAYSPAVNPRAGWQDEVAHLRVQLHRVLRDSPSLHARIEEIVDGEIDRASRHAFESLSLRGESTPPWRGGASWLRSHPTQRLLGEGWFPNQGEGSAE